MLGLLLQMPGVIEWTVDKHPEVLQVLGEPKIIETNLGKAVEFDGVDDGLFLDSVPVAGMEEFTIEMIFNQYPGSAFEQRFMHLGAYGGARVMFESRVKPDDSWYFDAFVHLGSKPKSCVLIDPELTHPCGRWYNLTLTAGKDGLKSYVDGVGQCSGDLAYEPVINEGKTSLGVRQNLVCWFKGAIYKLRITPRILKPAEFLRDQDELNRMPYKDASLSAEERAEDLLGRLSLEQKVSLMMNSSPAIPDKKMFFLILFNSLFILFFYLLIKNKCAIYITCKCLHLLVSLNNQR